MSPQSTRQAIGRSRIEFIFALAMLLLVTFTGVAASGIAEVARLERLATMNGSAPVALIGAADVDGAVKP
jgi:hypothetical protein